MSDEIKNRETDRDTEDVSGQMPLEALRLETFSPRIGETFRAFVVDGEPTDLKLTEASGTGGPELERPPFSLVFQAAEGVILEQRMYTVEHAELGSLDVFLVPLTPSTCEAVFT